MHHSGVDVSAGGHRHHLSEAGPVLLEEQAALEVGRVVRLAQHVVNPARIRVAFELAHHGPGMDVVHAGEPHPFRDHAERDAVRSSAGYVSSVRLGVGAGSCRCLRAHFAIDWIAV